MSALDLRILLSDAYTRAIHAAQGWEFPGIRRAFKRALAALDAGDRAPAVLLLARWP